MKYWKECEHCGGKGWLKNVDVAWHSYRENNIGALVICPHCSNGIVDATAEFRQMKDSIEAARLAIESAQYSEALNILDESVKETK